MAKRKKYKTTNNDRQNIHIKQKIEKHEPHYKPRVNSGAPKDKKFLLHYAILICLDMIFLAIIKRYVSYLGLKTCFWNNLHNF